MISLSSSLNSLTEVFGDGDERVAAEKTLGFLLDHPNTRHINIGLVRQITRDGSISDQAILRTLQFLAGDSIGILSPKFEFLDADDEPQDISVEEAKIAALDQINPFSGVFDPECGQRLLLYFEPTGVLER